MPETLPRTAARLVLTGAVLVSACSDAPETTPEYRVLLGIGELMHEVLDPAADVIWDSAGYDITRAGERSLAPQTDDGWAQVAQSAAVLMEAANALMLPGRGQPGDWNEIAAGMADAAVAARAAAQRQDHGALFEAGGTLYRTCLACHRRYWSESR